MLIDYLLLDRGRIMDNNTIESFIRKQKVAFICSVDEEGFPNVLNARGGAYDHKR